MNTDPNTITSNGLSGPIPFPRVCTTPRGVTSEYIAPAQAAKVAQVHDPRWVFAMRIRSRIESDQSKEYREMIDEGKQHGLSPMQSGLIIGIVERAHERGGIDSIAYEEVQIVPDHIHDGIAMLSNRSRWIVFGALFAWAMTVAGLMQIVA